MALHFPIATHDFTYHTSSTIKTVPSTPNTHRPPLPLDHSQPHIFLERRLFVHSHTLHSSRLNHPSDAYSHPDLHVNLRLRSHSNTSHYSSLHPPFPTTAAWAWAEALASHPFRKYFLPLDEAHKHPNHLFGMANFQC
jgi:hypothetical protein